MKRRSPNLSEQNLSHGKFVVILPLFFFSGLVALVYEVLWFKELGLLFGNTAFAAAATLAAFFSGLAVGGYFWGQRAASLYNPLQTYGLLELAVALSVIGYFQILDAYHVLYPVLFETFGESRRTFVLVKFLLAIILLFPASFFIGGTLPVITQSLVRNTNRLGRKVSVLYAVNILGAATGSLLAGFYLPALFGFSLSYKFALACSAAIGCIALILARRWPVHQNPEVSAVPNPRIQTEDHGIPMATIRALALVSGFGTLCLQVLWTHMFAQVLQNSVYTFATIVFVFLLVLAAGAVLANRLMRNSIRPFYALFGLITAGAMLVAASPFVFNAWTDGLQYIGQREAWAGYLLLIFKMEIAVMALPVLVVGAIFPFLLKTAEPYASSSGRVVGHLVALNTVGSILGSLTAGFVIIDSIGVWAGIRLLGVIYLLAALYLLYIPKPAKPALAALPMVGILLLVSVLDTSRLPRVRVDPVDDEESLLQLWEASSGTVAVVRRGDWLKIKVNNYYTLGGSGSRELEEVEGYLPVLLHRNPESVFFLGLGTGISAGAVLRFSVQRLVVAELIPEVIQASNKYFRRFNNNLFFDPRARLIEEDGRNVLAGNREKFDLIIADLFVPWRCGAGSLYSLEHYRTVRERLRDQGLFMQWLPGYQLSEAEFGSIVRTLLEVFPQLTLWRGDFSSRKPILGLLAQPEKSPLAPNALLFSDKNRSDHREQAPILAHYVGNIGLLRDEWMAYPLNSDDRPLIEFQSPITQRRQKNREVTWLAEERLIQLMEHVQGYQGFANDPYLRNLSAGLRMLPRAGMLLHRSRLLKQQGRLSASKKFYARYQKTLENLAVKDR